MRKEIFVFNLARKQILNSNDRSMGNWRVAMGIKKYLRELSCQMATARHSEGEKVFFDHCKVTTIVCPPTKRIYDPPNLAPTSKAILDGMTDAGYWEDDNFRHIVDSSFRYGGLSGEKDRFKLIVILEEVPEEELGNYVLDTVVNTTY